MSNSFVEILLSCALSKESTDKINTQIKNIQKDLKDITIDFNVNNNSSKKFKEMEKSISSLQKQNKELQSQLSNIGKSGGGKPSSNPFKPIEDGAEQALKSIVELQDYIRKNNGKIKIIDDSATGKVKEVVTTITNELGKIEKKVYRPVVDVQMNDLGFKGFAENTKITDITAFDNLQKKIESTKRDIDELGRTGKLTSTHFDELKKGISNTMSNSDVDALLVKMKEFSRVDTHNTKWTDTTKNIQSQTKETIAELERMKQVASNLGIDTKQFDSLISKMKDMSNIKITDDSQIKTANKEMSKMLDRVDDLKSYNDNYQKAIQLVQQYGRQGKLSAKEIEDFNKKLANTGNNANLQQLINQMKELSKINVSDNKHHNATKNLNDNANKSIEALEKLRQKASNLNMDTKQIDSLISKMRMLSNIEITNDAQIGKADKLYGRLSSRVSETRNQMDSLATAQTKFNTVLKDTENKGVFKNVEDLYRYQNGMEEILSSSAKLETKLEKLKQLVSKFNTELSETQHTNKMAEGIQRAENEAKRLEAMLTRTENSYRRTVNRNDVAEVRAELERMNDVPTFSNQAELRAWNQQLEAIQTRIRGINADAVTGARANLGIIESLKVALERFPIDNPSRIKTL